ncbi:MAG: hypothetical protein U9R41_07070 [Candidatus Marinimicrobia bacterium]|nr:hypothetical protein [Candidatus Neomarinimicrobiota bacterium]
MKSKKILKELENLIKENEIDIVYGVGTFSGGYCLLNNLPVVVVNKRIPIEEKETVLVNIIISKKIDFSKSKKAVKEFINRFN